MAPPLRQWLLVVLAAFTLSSAMAADPTPEYARLGEQIRRGEVDVGKEFSMAIETGRYHRIHGDVLLLDCASCHGGGSYKADFLSVSKYQPVSSANDQGRIEKTSCLGCHREGGMGAPFYTGSTE